MVRGKLPFLGSQAGIETKARMFSTHLFGNMSFNSCLSCFCLFASTLESLDKYMCTDFVLSAVEKGGEEKKQQ